MRPPLSLTFSKPVKRRMLSMASGVGSGPPSKPNPQALTSGATVMSSAPPVFSATSWARLNTWMNSSSGVAGSPRLMADITDRSLKRRERRVDPLQLGLDAGVEVGVTLVCDVVDRAEHRA